VGGEGSARDGSAATRDRKQACLCYGTDGLVYWYVGWNAKRKDVRPGKTSEDLRLGVRGGLLLSRRGAVGGGSMVTVKHI